MSSVVSLTDICDFLSGYAWASAGFSTVATGTPVIRIQNVATLNPDKDFIYWTGEFDRRFLISEGDILLSMSGSFRCCRWSGPEALLNQRVVKLLPKLQLVDPDFLVHTLKSKLLEIERMGRHALVNNVAIADLKNLKIYLPPLPEQKRIAAILDKADDIRRKREKAIELTDSFLRSVFLEMFGDPILNEKNWETKELGTLVSMIGGYAFKSSDYVDDGIPLVKIGNANRSDFDVRNLSFLPHNYMDSHRRFLLSPGDMVMSLTGTTGKDDYGNINVVPETYSRWFLNQRVAKITIKNELTPSYLLGLLSNRRFKANLISVSRGVRQANLRNEDLLLQRVPCPPRELQQKYDRIVELITNLRLKMQEAKKRSICLPQSLATRIMYLKAGERIETFAEEAHAL